MCSKNSIVFMLLMSWSALSAPSPGNTLLKPADRNTCSAVLSKFNEQTQQVVDIFLDLSKIPRGSGNEKKIREYIIALARKTGHEFETDKAGNVIVTVPATGVFEANNNYSIALQSHIDMVQMIPGSTRASEASKAFENGVPNIEFDGSTVHTAGVSTLGADNGIGVAAALRYLYDKSIDHPRLRLLFTVEEETTFKGANAIKIPTDVKAIVNLDMEQLDQITIGCQGSCRWTAEYVSPTEKVPLVAIPLRGSVSGFLGGHSGIDIHRNRGNVARLVAEFLLNSLKRFPSLQIIEIHSGIKTVFNKIPDSAEFDIAVSEMDYPMFNALFKHQVAQWNRQFGQETTTFQSMVKSQLAQWGWVRQQGGEEAKPIGTLKTSPVHSRYAIARQEIRNLLQLFLIIRDGPILAGEGLPNDWNLTSNQAYLNLEGNSKEAKLSFGVMSRAYESEPLQMFVQASVLQAKQYHNRKEVKVTHESPPWIPKPDSPLIPLVTEAMKEAGVTVSNVGVVAGGLETAAFAHRYPDIPVVSIGPDVFDVHSPKERFSVPSVEQFLKVLDRVLFHSGNAFRD
jgi:dipeptidase D